MAERKIGYAVVGLGHIAQSQVLPSFAHAPNARLVALVSGDEAKRRELGESYGVRHLYDYGSYDECLANEEVDAVYVALPNDQHCEYTVRAAKAGVHVLCEKPMALNEAECREMIGACDEAGVKLMIAYRLHFEPANLRAIEAVEKGELGDPRFFSSVFGYQVKAGNIRTSSERGGGPLWDLGVYCVNASRYLFREEPVEVFATFDSGSDERFADVEAAATVLMRFPGDRTATFTCSFASAALASYRLVGTEADLRMDDAYEYALSRKLTLNRGGEAENTEFPVIDQFGPQLDYFARCILEDRQPEPDGEEGLADVRVIEAIRLSAREGRPVSLPSFQRRARPSRAQEYRIEAPNEGPEVGVEAPSAD